MGPELEARLLKYLDDESKAEYRREMKEATRAMRLSQEGVEKSIKFIAEKQDSQSRTMVAITEELNKHEKRDDDRHSEIKELIKGHSARLTSVESTVQGVVQQQREAMQSIPDKVEEITGRFHVETLNHKLKAKEDDERWLRRTIIGAIIVAFVSAGVAHFLTRNAMATQTTSQHP